MNRDNRMNLLLAPIISEKAVRVGDGGQCIVFKVQKKATKPQVREAVEALFEVKVEAVRMLNVRGKEKRFGRMIGRRPDWKKAYVTLKEGYDIDFSPAA